MPRFALHWLSCCTIQNSVLTCNGCIYVAVLISSKFFCWQALFLIQTGSYAFIIVSLLFGLAVFWCITNVSHQVGSLHCERWSLLDMLLDLWQGVLVLHLSFDYCFLVLQRCVFRHSHLMYSVLGVLNFCFGEGSYGD